MLMKHGSTDDGTDDDDNEDDDHDDEDDDDDDTTGFRKLSFQRKCIARWNHRSSPKQLLQSVYCWTHAHAQRRPKQ